MAGGRSYRSDDPAFYASRADRNQPETVSAFRKLGYSVACLHAAGEGVFDLLVGKHGLAFLCEVKDGEKCPSARQYTPKQRKFNFSWQGMKCVATCLDDVFEIDRQFKNLITKIKAAEIKLEIEGCKDEIYSPSLF